MMCKNCDCDFIERCSIVNFLPVGFCCENCNLYDAIKKCIKSEESSKVVDKQDTDEVEDLKLINATIENDLLKVTISEKGGSGKTIYINIKKHLK